MVESRSRARGCACAGGCGRGPAANKNCSPWRAAILEPEALGARQVLQLYAAQALSGGGGGGGGGDAQAADAAGPAEAAVQALLAADEERWDALLQEAAAGQVHVRSFTEL
jgi:hypothetical protein